MYENIDKPILEWLNRSFFFFFENEDENPFVKHK